MGLIRGRSIGSDFGLDSSANRSAFVLALAGLTTTFAVYCAFGVARLISWWVVLSVLFATSRLWGESETEEAVPAKAGSDRTCPNLPDHFGRGGAAFPS